MSRVYDAIRRADDDGEAPPPIPGNEDPRDPQLHSEEPVRIPEVVDGSAIVRSELHHGILQEIQSIRYDPAPEAHLLDLNNPHETPAEEFRTLRTRLNHLQSLQPLHNVIVTSASPAEGKTFSSVNLALSQAQLSESLILLGDFDLRRPSIHDLFQVPRAPGLSDYLRGDCRFQDAVRRIEGINLYLMTAGSPVKNPLELLNTRQAKSLFEELPRYFNWSIFDTPPLLFSADANLLASLADGLILVVRIGSTTFDNVTRAMQSLCENNLLGIVANGARAAELYSKYTYYYSKVE